MRKAVLFCLLIAAAFAIVGCVAQKRVEGGYSFVTTSAGLLNPDALPGTSLHYRGSRVWPVVFPEYYWPEPASKFYHDGLFVFAGSVLGNDGYNAPLPGPHLYAVRGKGPPVIISQRVFQQPLTNEYQVAHIASVPDGVRVRFECYGRWVNGHTTYSTNDVSWADISNWVREAEISAPLRTTARGDYRVLPMARPNPQGGPNGRQPFGSETNSTSGAAASRRSP